VLVEKPITIASADGERLVALAAERDLRLGVVFQRRADPVFRHVADALHAGALGRVVAVGLTLPYHRDDAYYASAAWRGTWALDGGGVLDEPGHPPARRAGVVVRRPGRRARLRGHAGARVEVEDTAAAVLRFGPGPAEGALGTVLATTASSPGHPHALDVLGTRGSLRLEGERVVRWDVEGVPAPPASATADGGARDPRATDTTNHSTSKSCAARCARCTDRSPTTPRPNSISRPAVRSPCGSATPSASSNGCPPSRRLVRRGRLPPRPRRPRPRRDQVLDLGSGSGMDSFVAALRVGPRAGPGHRHDRRPAPQGDAPRRAHGFDQVAFADGLIEDLPAVDDCVDVVISNGVINLAADKDAVFREIARVLRPGGKMAISDIVTEKPLTENIVCDSSLWAACIGGAAQVDAYRRRSRTPGSPSSRLRENPDYALPVEVGAGATEQFGVKSVSLLARLPAETGRPCGRSASSTMRSIVRRRAPCARRAQRDGRQRRSDRAVRASRRGASPVERTDGLGGADEHRGLARLAGGEGGARPGRAGSSTPATRRRPHAPSAGRP
jgi:SAM-dependent methyltransferase